MEMDAERQKRFEVNHPGESLPRLRRLDEAETRAIRDGLKKRLNLSTSTDGLVMVKTVESLLDYLPNTDAEQDNFDLVNELKSLNISASATVLLNWHQFDDVDEFDLQTLSARFQDIWYPGADDVDVFDRTLTWILSIRHDGVVGIARLGM